MLVRVCAQVETIGDAYMAVSNLVKEQVRRDEPSYSKWYAWSRGGPKCLVSVGQRRQKPQSGGHVTPALQRATTMLAGSTCTIVCTHSHAHTPSYAPRLVVVQAGASATQHACKAKGGLQAAMQP